MQSKVFIIAEAGINHNGNLELAKQMIDVAKDLKVDAIKFQTGKSKNVISRFAPKAQYQIENTNNSQESQLEMDEKYDFQDDSVWPILKDYCDKKNILFLSSPFDFESIELLDKLGMQTFKIPSGEITNLPYLRKIGKLDKKIILSTGMSNLGEIETAISILTDAGTKRENITILHCNTEYPTPMQDVNLRAMQTIANAFHLPVGYSDHTQGIHIPIAAVAMGAKVIEKHFTLDKNMEGPDHKASLEPHELKEMIGCIREIEIALGNGIKQESKSEKENKKVVRKSIVANRAIKAGEVFSEENLYVKRPANGLSPMEWDNVIGKIAKKDFDEDECIEL
ncbi:N-acetylneuraminate synthase [Helicobacter brantae]|uniref:N-acetylneuraminate synthase n=1 Tax=Helicobacter brantae TaxID=375927 RepID=A0A3D8J3Z4_9HELI|nr:N-acetylneuraminate synthase [Helicobacter brantae]RDU72143.1 N-acetylneuraminate synthase [Helicobacter brantae]